MAMTLLGDMKLSHNILDFLGFEFEKGGCKYFKVELDAKGWALVWCESLKDYFIEPKFQPTSRIRVSTVDKLHAAYILITDKNFNL